MGDKLLCHFQHVGFTVPEAEVSVFLVRQSKHMVYYDGQKSLGRFALNVTFDHVDDNL